MHLLWFHREEEEDIKQNSYNLLFKTLSENLLTALPEQELPPG